MRQSILAGDLAPHQPLDAAQIAQHQECESWVVEHAFASLVEEGLVEPDGQRVKSLTKSEALDLIEVHRGIRLHAVELGAPRLTSPDVANLRELRTAMQGAIADRDGRGAGRISAAFNQVIYGASGSAELMRILESTDPAVIRMVNLAVMRGRFDPMLDMLQEAVLRAAEQRDHRGIVEQYVRTWARFQLVVEDVHDDDWPDWG
ncbi:MAG: GntR family transcriptional regulator [Coriobacteriales bacterium]|nr:GntR family transcriptional regulator [Coriobacteriales bacterium]